MLYFFRMKKAVIGFAIALSFAAAGPLLAQEGAASAGGAAAANVSVEGAASIGEAAKQAEQVAVSSGLTAAVNNVWRLAWEKTWPFIKSMALKFWGLMRQAAAVFTAPVPSQVEGPAANVNGGANVNAAADANVNAAEGGAVNAP